jgi:hypothetical protein
VQESNKVTLVGGIIRGYSSKVWQSTDGNRWTELSSGPQFSPRTQSQVVEFLGDLWVIGGYTAETTANNEIWRSSDGINWTHVTPVGTVFTPRDGDQVVVFNNRLWVIGGWDDLVSNGGTNTYTNDVWSSADGVNWVQQIPSGPIFLPRAGHQAAVLNGKLWVIGGQGAGSTYLNDVWSTTDGVHWTQETPSATFAGRTVSSVVAFNNTLWLFGGTNGTTIFSDIWKSTDGASWSLVTPSSSIASARYGHAAVVYNNRIWVVGGGTVIPYPYNPMQDVWSTGDGMNWTQHTAGAPFGPRVYHALTTHNNELWVIGGVSLDLRNDVWRSANGVDWRVGFSQNFTTH